MILTPPILHRNVTIGQQRYVQISLVAVSCDTCAKAGGTRHVWHQFRFVPWQRLSLR